MWGGIVIKKLLLLIIFCFLLVGCNKMDSQTAIKDFKKIVENNDKYTLTGMMDIVSNEEVYHYDVTVDYMNNDYYKASLINKDTSHEQIILKNKAGVYVITPSLNKSYKFQSGWPDNSSQAYILSSLLKDLENDSNVLLEEKDEQYILTSTVNYPNNTSLINQKITFDKNMIPKEVIVYDKNGLECIVFKISKIDFDTGITEESFDVENYSSDEEITSTEQTSASVGDVVYPMYLPIGTKFKSEETVKTDNQERVILTFTGDKSFILIEEASIRPKEFEVTTTSGELVFYENVLGTLGESSLNWTMNGKDYYIIGTNLTNEELLKVASSTSVVSLSK